MEEQDEVQAQEDAFSFSRQLAQAQQGSAPPPGAAGPGGAPAGAPAQGQAPAPGQPGPGGPAGSDPISQVDQLVPKPGQKIDPETMYSTAQSVAQLLLDPSVSDGARHTKLLDIKKQNPPFHGLVKQLLSEIRSDAASKGRDMVLNQQNAAPPGS
jgi:hypothetical protein